MSGEGNSKFTEPRIEACLAALRIGCTRKASAGAAGVTAQTFYRWLDDATFRDEVEKAEAQAEAAYTSVVQQATATSWQAAAWWLERRKYMDFGKRDRIDMSIDVRQAIESLTDDPAEIEAAVAEAERIVRR